MRSNEVPGFLPSRHGFAFPNRWPTGPAFEWRVGYLRIGIGEVSDGLCGGMCFAAADGFLRGGAPPTDAVPPVFGTPLFGEIARRQLDSLELGLVPLRFWWASARLRTGRWTGRDQAREWRAIRAELDGGRPAMVGLVRAATANPLALTANHQVLAFAYEAGPVDATIRIYDPNHPGRDDVTIRLHVAGRSVTAGQSTGEPLLGVLSLPYRPAPEPADASGPAARRSR
ncbi:MAG TPA: hypothetical protein VLS28_03130 [Candidatus Sulfomarinibacteraceae bacterium]|nr:hypothetical protein [Candidatus Sulfomarinibacteraceae bacterium]